MIIELLEDESVNDFNVVIEFINKVKKMGVRIAIDDYGSGYSNLERVFQFQPDFLKIDGSIIQGRSQGVNDSGSLEILTEDGVKIFASGEITVRSTT